ncbi:hypothetical protein H4I95_06162 [Botrytis cinerea]
MHSLINCLCYYWRSCLQDDGSWIFGFAQSEALTTTAATSANVRIT